MLLRKSYRDPLGDEAFDDFLYEDELQAVFQLGQDRDR